MRRLLATLALTAVAVTSVALTTPAEAATAATGAGTKYYVNCSASTSGDGTSDARAWSRLGDVTAHGAFVPGDQILLKRGTTCKGRLLPTGSGTKGSPIVLGAYGTGKTLPTIAGGGTAIGTGAVQLVNQHDWTIQDLHITNKGTGKETSAYRAGVLLLNERAGHLARVVVQRLKVDGVISNLAFSAGDAREFGGIAAVTYGAKGDGFDDLRIMNNTVTGVGRTGIVVSNHAWPKGYDRGLRIAGNSVVRARGDSIIVRGSNNARIDHNVSANGADLWPCKQCGRITPYTANAGVWTAASKTVRIDHNEVYGERMKGGDGEGFDIDSSAENVVLEYNYAHDNEGGGVLFCGSKNAIARFNIFENNGKSAFAFIGNIPTKQKTQIYNNTVYSSSKSKARIVRYFNGAHSAPITFKNNLLYNYGYASYLWPTKKVSTASNTLIGLHGAGRPAGPGTSWANPGLNNPGTGRNGMKSLNGYKPKHPSSFARGAAISSSVKVDFFGKKINPKKPPRGAAG